MKYIAECLPSLVNGHKVVPLVMDDEAGLFDAVGRHLTQVKRIICWNHLINSIKTWLRKHGATSAEIPAYVSCIRDLLCQPSAASYEEKLQSFQAMWSQPFCSYYMESVHAKVLLYSKLQTH